MVQEMQNRYSLTGSEEEIAEIRPDGSVAPWPDLSWQTREDDFQTPQGIRLDLHGILWVLDYGRNRLGGTPIL